MKPEDIETQKTYGNKKAENESGPPSQEVKLSRTPREGTPQGGTAMICRSRLLSVSNDQTQKKETFGGSKIRGVLQVKRWLGGWGQGGEKKEQAKNAWG